MTKTILRLTYVFFIVCYICTLILMYLNLFFQEIRDRTGLQKAYYLFINSIALNNLMCVITNLGKCQLSKACGFELNVSTNYG